MYFLLHNTNCDIVFSLQLLKFNLTIFYSYFALQFNKTLKLIMEELTSSPIPGKHLPCSSFSFSLQVLTLTPSHLICQEALRWGQQSSAPSCDEVKVRAVTSPEATRVTQCAWMTESSERTSYIRRPSMLFFLKRERCGCWDNWRKF